MDNGISFDLSPPITSAFIDREATEGRCFVLPIAVSNDAYIK